MRYIVAFFITLMLAVALVPVQPVFSGEPVVIKVIEDQTIGGWGTDSTTVKRYTVDLKKEKIDISQNLYCYWKFVSTVGAVNVGMNARWAPINATTFEAGTDSLRLNAARTSEAAASDTLFAPIGARYLSFYVDPNLGSPVTGISDTQGTIMLVGQKASQ